MVESTNLHHSNLHMGHWAGSQARAKTPQPFEAMTAPVRANQSSKIDRQVPRSFDLIPRYPPPPSVEDEAQSLAKEIGGSVASSVSTDEEPKNRGELEQHPILKAVDGDDDADSSPCAEWRFIHVGSMPSGGPGAQDGAAKATPAKGEYEANTCRKFTMPFRPVEKQSDKLGDAAVDQQENEPLKSRRRRSDLPRIETDIATGSDHPQRSSRTPAGTPARTPARSPSRERRRDSSRGPSRSSSRMPTPMVHRPRSSTYIDQEPIDYFDRQESRGASGDSFLSPAPSVIKHATKGRDRAYVDFHASGNGGESRRRSSTVSRPPPLDAYSERRSAVGLERLRDPSEETPMHRRSASAVELPKPYRRPSDREGRRPETRYYGDVPSPRSSRRNLSPRSERRNESPQRSDRRSSPPSRRYSQRERPSRGDPGYTSQRSQHTRNHSDDSSDEHSFVSRRSARDGRDRPKSFVGHSDQNYLLSPDSSRPHASARMGSSRRGTPLPSPRSSAPALETYSPLPSPRPSTTLPISSESRRRDNRPTSPESPGLSSSPPKSPLKTHPTVVSRDSEASQRPLSRAHSRLPGMSTSVSAPAAVAGIAVATAVSATTEPSEPTTWHSEPPIERGRMPGPASTRGDSISSNSSQNYWQPPTAASQHRDLPNQTLVPAEQNPDGAEEGSLPICRRQIPEAGLTDWITLPLASTFNICPDCYGGIFARTEFAHLFIAAPCRPTDRPIACDMGTSFWYRMAWLLIRKQRLPNLQLLQNIAVGTGKHQPCPLDKSATRVWLTIRLPGTGQPLESFTACLYCAEAVQALFPNLAGTFQPLNYKAEPTVSVCSLHFVHNRKQFLEYYEVLEEVSDDALARGSAPDVRRLFVGLQRISDLDCARDQQLQNREWYVMRSVPDLTVCRGCYCDVVLPERARENLVARQFHTRPVYMRRPTTCQLYSQRMRHVFNDACRTNRIDLIAQLVGERLAIETECKNKIAQYEALNASSGGAYQNKLDYYTRQWQRVE